MVIAVNRGYITARDKDAAAAWERERPSARRRQAITKSDAKAFSSTLGQIASLFPGAVKA